MNPIALEVKDLVKTFALDGTTINAVDHVSFQVRSGELWPGAKDGKTTMLSISALLSRQWTGASTAGLQR
jgi:ABC-type dipeptide/oligopeptide/nickel transport system ATPase subunit